LALSARLKSSPFTKLGGRESFNQVLIGQSKVYTVVYIAAEVVSVSNQGCEAISEWRQSGGSIAG
jgi:hypothetical protein